MPRNSGGTYTLPETAFQPNTAISSSAMNSDLDDIADALTVSLDREGNGGMLAPLKGNAGTEALPGYAFLNDPDTGIYRKSANVLGIVAGGTEVAEISADGLNVTSGEYLFEGDPIAFQAVPVGIPQPYIFGSLPSADFLWMDGGQVTTSHPILRNALVADGNRYGTGGGNPLLPDWRGRAPFGRDDMGGSAANRITTAGSGIDGITLGANGGAQNIEIPLAAIPETSVPNVEETTTTPIRSGDLIPIKSKSMTVGSGGEDYDILNFTDGTNRILVGQTTKNHEHENGGVTPTPLNKMPPAVICNYIIRGR